MIDQSEAQARLSIYRYAILAVVITAFTVSLVCPVVLTANPNYTSLTFDDVFIPSLFVASAGALIGIMSYFIYAQMLKKQVTKSKFIIG